MAEQPASAGTVGAKIIRKDGKLVEPVEPSKD